MKILPVNNTYTSNTPKKPSFRSLYCNYELPDNVRMGLYTWLFREDIDWKGLAELESENFKNKDKVNIIQFAASDGSEGYTQILSLLKYVKSSYEKYFPIKSYDINKSVINDAKQGYLNLRIHEVKRMQQHGIDVDQYFSGASDYYIENRSDKFALPKTVKVSRELTKRIQFNLGDMFEILPKIQDDSNTIILCRNCLGFYNQNVVEKFVLQASRVLKTGSLFVTGILEGGDSMQSSFLRNGFSEVMKGVYRKL